MKDRLKIGLIIALIGCTGLFGCNRSEKLVRYSGHNTFLGKNKLGFNSKQLTIEIELFGDSLVLINNGWTGEKNYHGIISVFLNRQTRGDTTVYEFESNFRSETYYDSIYWYKATKDVFAVDCYFGRAPEVETFGVSKMSKKKIEGYLNNRYFSY